MDLPLSPKSPKSPRRQLTLGPATPIQDWEVERATLLKNFRESHEKAERLEKLLEEEQTTFEKNTSSLLREVKLKETHLEKKLKDVEHTLMRQILNLEQQLEDSKTEHQNQIKSLKVTHTHALDTEDKKYQRRLLGLQERLRAKDKDYVELLEKNKTDEEKDALIETLKLKLAEAENFGNAKENKDTLEDEVDDLEVRYQSMQGKLGTAENDLSKYQEREKEFVDRIHQLEKQASQYKKRIDQASTGYNSQIQSLTEKFMSEAKQSEMINQARIQNLQSEHDEVLRELREQHQTEKEVWSIEQCAAVDEVRRVLMLEKNESIERLNNEWKEKHDDLYASMSKDSTEIQSHWEKKREESKNQYSAKLARLMGEMEVIKDRLGKEIERRKQNEYALNDSLVQNDVLLDKLNVCQMRLKQRIGVEKEIYQLKNTYKSSSRLAKEVLSIVSPNTSLNQNTDLQEMLRLILHNTLMIDTRQDSSDVIF
ncbi:hypothetical protein G6F56_007237 [Rhizopus delemar]|nr:hypothetical protein G6F56_007237 [Rhizopus delemar]